MKHEIRQRIARLRDEMKSHGIDAVIIPQSDPHHSEYLAGHWQLRRFLSGFTGSAGTLVVTQDDAALWTDSRYFLQAADQLDGTDIVLMKEGVEDTPPIADYLTGSLGEGKTVGIDGMLFSINDTDELRGNLDKKGINLDVSFNVADKVWPERPSLPDDKIFIHEEKFAGRSASDKIAEVMKNVHSQGADAVFISALDEIAWTLNIRSSDVESNPVAMAFLYLSHEGSTLFVNERKVTPEIIEYLSQAGITTAPYDAVEPFLRNIPDDRRVLVSVTQSAGALLPILGRRAVTGTSPVAGPKSIKNDTQVKGIRNAMIRDGVALVKAFMEIEDILAANRQLTETDIASILTKHRSHQELYFDQSFDTIAGWGAHGAIVHYSANKKTDATIEGDNLLLIDSGANYLDGTTDITRTIAIGTPTEEQRHDFTLVMKGHIALATAIFPKGTRGGQIDCLARQYLWQEGKTYLHGTGHGVGHFLNVHEGPQRISLLDNTAPLAIGMVTSNEPGLYRTGMYGIRCENLMLTVPAFTTEFGEFLRFETLTLFPFDLSLFDTSIMSDAEIDWVNNYHTRVREHLSPLLDVREKSWLEMHTAPLSR